MAKLNTLVLLCSYLTLVAAYAHIYNRLPDLFYEYYDDVIVTRNSLKHNVEKNPRNQTIVCGNFLCVESVYDIVENTNGVIIPNARNITCVECYNKSGVVTSVTKLRPVDVFEEINDSCYRRRTEKLNISDGCKCYSN